MNKKESGRFMSNKGIPITLFLFLIGVFHTLIFGIFQMPGTFLTTGLDIHPIPLQVTFYLSTFIVSCLNQPIAKRIGLKNLLIWGIVSNGIGICILVFHHYLGYPHQIFSSIVAMIFMGIAFLSIINVLITYVILRFPNHTMTGITLLFAALNLGLMSSPFLIYWAGGSKEIVTLIYALIIAWKILAIIVIAKWFSEPTPPKHHEQLRSGTLLWKEMHQRILFYALAILLYGLAESSFTLWGNRYLEAYFSASTAFSVMPIYWIFTIGAQIVLSCLFFYHCPRQLFQCFVFFIIVGLYFLSSQTSYPLSLPQIVVSFAIGGLGCAAIFPILLSVFEMEIIQITISSVHHQYLPFIEVGVSFMTAAYLLGVGIDNILLTMEGLYQIDPFIKIGILFILGTSILKAYLDRTREVKIHN